MYQFVYKCCWSAPIEIAGASFTLIFSLTTGIIKKLLSITRNKKKNHDKILVLAKSKLDSTEALISQALADIKISHEEFVTILREKDKYEKIKGNVKNVTEKLEEKTENTRLNSVNSRIEFKTMRLQTRYWLKIIKNFMRLIIFFCI